MSAHKKAGQPRRPSSGQVMTKVRESMVQGGSILISPEASLAMQLEAITLDDLAVGVRDTRAKPQIGSFRYDEELAKWCCYVILPTPDCNVRMEVLLTGDPEDKHIDIIQLRCPY